MTTATTRSTRGERFDAYITQLGLLLATGAPLRVLQGGSTSRHECSVKSDSAEPSPPITSCSTQVHGHSRVYLAHDSDMREEIRWDRCPAESISPTAQTPRGSALSYIAIESTLFWACTTGKAKLKNPISGQEPILQYSRPFPLLQQTETLCRG